MVGTVALAILAGVLFRFIGLEQGLVWHDEVATRIFAAGYNPHEWREVLFTAEVFDLSDVLHYQVRNDDRSLWQAITGLAADDPQHPPLYYVLIRAWSGLFGNSIGALRTLSALFGMLMLPCIFWLSMELFSTKRAAWTATALAAVSPFFVLYGQEAREYALWATLIVLSTAMLLRAVRVAEMASRPPILAWSLYGLCMTISLYTSFSTVAVLGAHAAFIAIVQRSRLSSVTLSFALAIGCACLAFLPWTLALIHHFEAFEASMRWSREIVIPNSALLRIQSFNASRTLVDFWPELETPTAWVVTTLVLSFITYALVHLARKGPSRARVMMFVLIATPLMLTLVPDLLFGGIRSVSSRYMTPTWIAVSLTIAHMVTTVSISQRLRDKLVATLLALGIMSCWSNSTKEVVWTKGTSLGLPAIARLINASPQPLVVSDFEVHHPGNMMALSTLLRPSTKMQFLTHDLRSVYTLPEHSGDIFLVSPIPPFRDEIETTTSLTARLIYEDIYLQLWKLDPGVRE
jgi:uncharacterized membrane protein